MVTTAETLGSYAKITGVLRGDLLLHPQRGRDFLDCPFTAQNTWALRSWRRVPGLARLWARPGATVLSADGFALVLILLLLSTSIEGEYVPVEGDEVTYKMCPIPPKNQKFQAVEVVLTQLAPHTPHETWSGQVVGS